MFRSLSDQIHGSDSHCHELRAAIVDHMAMDANKHHFSLFMEDDEPFDDYIERMR